MTRLAKLAMLAFFAGVLVAAGAEETGHLTADQLAKAARSDLITIPTPGELFAALGKTGKTNWSGQYRGPIPVTYRNRDWPAILPRPVCFSRLSKRREKLARCGDGDQIASSGFCKLVRREMTGFLGTSSYQNTGEKCKHCQFSQTSHSLRLSVPGQNCQCESAGASYER